MYFWAVTKLNKMKLTINHIEEEFTNGELSLEKLLENKELTFKRLLIRINGVLISEDQKQQAKLKDGDVLDIVRIISGG